MLINKKILVIEDEAHIRDSVAELLEFADYEVVTAPNGREGVKLAKTASPDLILCDVMMPELDGYGVLLELSQNPKLSTIPFIFLTARTHRSDIRKGMVLGADDYLTKPFTSDELITAVRSRLDKHDAIAQYATDELKHLQQYINVYLPHELRTPLGCIIGYMSLLEEDIGDYSLEEIRPMLASVSEAAERLYHLTENYIAFSHLQTVTANSEIRKRIKEIGGTLLTADIIRSSIQKVARQHDRLYDLNMEIENQQLEILEDHFTKLIEELGKNAFLFSSYGDRVDVSTQLADGFYQIDIRNQGRGMTEEQIGQIDLNVQFDREIYEQQGSGIGLMIVKRILDLYGGRLEIESVPENYIRFSALLPTP